VLKIEQSYRQAGACYLAGSATDVWGTMPGISLHVELKLLHKIGLSNRQVIAAATSNFARAFGWNHTGQMKPGCTADILILEKNPLEDLENLKQINRLFLRGREINRQKLLDFSPYN
jgi:imidazolonepropionase-like amidohydrolase